MSDGYVRPLLCNHFAMGHAPVHPPLRHHCHSIAVCGCWWSEFTAALFGHCTPNSWSSSSATACRMHPGGPAGPPARILRPFGASFSFSVTRRRSSTLRPPCLADIGHFLLHSHGLYPIFVLYTTPLGLHFCGRPRICGSRGGPSCIYVPDFQLLILWPLARGSSSCSCRLGFSPHPYGGRPFCRPLSSLVSPPLLAVVLATP